VCGRRCRCQALSRAGLELLPLALCRVQPVACIVHGPVCRRRGLLRTRSTPLRRRCLAARSRLGLLGPLAALLGLSRARTVLPRHLLHLRHQLLGSRGPLLRIPRTLQCRSRLSLSRLRATLCRQGSHRRILRATRFAVCAPLALRRHLLRPPQR
jgi:hypothetical protein